MYTKNTKGVPKFMASIEIMEKAALKFASMPPEGQDKVENILYGMQVMYEALKDKIPPDKPEEQTA